MVRLTVSVNPPFPLPYGQLFVIFLQEAGKSDDVRGMKNAFLIPFTMSHQALGILFLTKYQRFRL